MPSPAACGAILSGGEIRAATGDNQPILTERVLGKGRLWFCATLPDPQWSSLGDGRVLVPMLQRMLQQGAGGSRRVRSPRRATPRSWTMPRAGPARRRPRRATSVSRPGVYRNGSRLLAVNRPAEEDDPDRLEPGVTQRLFAPLKVQLFQERGSEPRNLQGEIWRALLFATLLFLNRRRVDLPAGRGAGAPGPQGTAPAREPQLAGAGRG